MYRGKISWFSAAALWMMLTSIVSAAELPYVVADDGTYLGEVSCSGSKALGNMYGSYGSRYETNSIWNKYGTYGSKYQLLSPYNPYTSTPPKIVFPDDTYTYLTVSSVKTPHMTPQGLEAMLMEKCNLNGPLRDE